MVEANPNGADVFSEVGSVDFIIFSIIVFPKKLSVAHCSV